MPSSGAVTQEVLYASIAKKSAEPVRMAEGVYQLFKGAGKETVTNQAGLSSLTP